MQARLALDGIELAYLSDGDPDAPLALCLHGFPDHAHTWDVLLPRLAAAGYHAVAPWLRGYAPSDLAPDDCYEVAASVRDMSRLIDQLGGYAPAVVVGHDWGAMITYGLCGHLGGRVRRAVAMALPRPEVFVPLLTGDFDQTRRSFYLFAFQVPGIGEMIAGGDGFLDRLIAEWSPGWDRSDTDRAHLQAAIGAPERLAAALGYYRQMFAPTSADPEIAELRAAPMTPSTVPTLLLMGADDGCINPERLPDQSALFPGGSRSEILDGCGHFLLQDDPERVGDLILDWLGPAGVD